MCLEAEVLSVDCVAVSGVSQHQVHTEGRSSLPILLTRAHIKQLVCIRRLSKSKQPEKMFSSSKITALCLAVVALSNGAYAEKEAAQTFGLLGAGLHGGAGLYGAGAAGLHGGAGVGAGLYDEILQEMLMTCSCDLRAVAASSLNASSILLAHAKKKIDI
ncbi:hypothetical protein PC119_g16762 [Phytophthora cactorum]|nr:hypothetical protein PC119_g16762 [Phytophthora cactorum]